MPKIIENLESRLLAEAYRQTREVGYSALTIRNVAKACGVGVGTVYNYFASKDELLATFLLEDWKQCLAAVEAESQASQEPGNVAKCIYDQLMQFARRHQNLFQDPGAADRFAGAFSNYHKLLRGQIALPLRKFCGSDFAAEFVAEALLTWTMARTPFDEIYGMIEKLFDVPQP